MLQKLSISNYALIDSIELDLDEGLNIITGETGAGKSIMLGALSLILGQRAETKYFFNQDKKCVIEGEFLFRDERLKPVFEEYDLDFSIHSFMRREISMDGKSRAFINDTPVTLAVMKHIGEFLIDIHSQHATFEINDPAFQLSVIDILSNHSDLLALYRQQFGILKERQQALKTVEQKAIDARQRQDYEQFLSDELELAALKSGEQEQLEAELDMLTNAESIKKGLLSSYQILGEQSTSVLTMLKEAVSQLQGIEKFNESYSLLNERLRSSMIEIKDIAEEIIGLEEQTIYDPQRIESMGSRLDLIYGLQQKHRVTSIDELLQIQHQLSESLGSLTDTEQEISRIRTQIEAITTDLENKSKLLSLNREKTIPIAEKLIKNVLGKVDMPDAKIKISHSWSEAFGKDGIDTLNFMFSANSGQTLAPIAKIASGGELSRLMLAVKSILANHAELPTLIFDEIDTGISGETALRVGSVIGELGKNMQVICITHLVQIASKGEAHYFVYKDTQAERTVTAIRKLHPDERIEKIAEMLSGKNPGASALENAKDLLGMT